MKPLRTGILGCGGFAHRHAQNLISLAEEIELVAFSDHHEQNARGSQKDTVRGKQASLRITTKCSRKPI